MKLPLSDLLGLTADRRASRIGGARMFALPLARTLAMRRGTVDVRSSRGEGTTFVLTFRGAQPGDLA